MLRKEKEVLYTESIRILISLDSWFNWILTLPMQLTQYNWPSVMLSFHRRILNAINRLSCYINCSEAVQTTYRLLAKRKSKPSWKLINHYNDIDDQYCEAWKMGHIQHWCNPWPPSVCLQRSIYQLFSITWFPDQLIAKIGYPQHYSNGLCHCARVLICHSQPWREFHQAKTSSFELFDNPLD